MLYEREVDPFMVWLESLPAWDKEPRLESWLCDVFKADGGCKLTEWASMFIPLGAVWRTYEPGEKLDEMPVLIGAQGCGKSTALRWLLPPDHPEWFTDGLHLASDSKSRVEALQGRVIVEAAEMAGSNRAELESLKSFLSRTDDGSVRLSFRRDPETALRRCVIVGTTNVGDCLPNDPTGNRRFVPIEVGPSEDGAAGVRRWLDSNREQIWAEAVYLYRMTFPHPRLPDSLKGAQSGVTARHRKRDDILEDRLAVWLDSEDRAVAFTLQDAAVGCGLVDTGNNAARLPMRDMKRLGAALILLGYDKRQQNHRRQTRHVLDPE